MFDKKRWFKKNAWESLKHIEIYRKLILYCLRRLGDLALEVWVGHKISASFFYNLKYLFLMFLVVHETFNGKTIGEIWVNSSLL